LHSGRTAKAAHEKLVDAQQNGLADAQLKPASDNQPAFSPRRSGVQLPAPAASWSINATPGKCFITKVQGTSRLNRNRRPKCYGFEHLGNKKARRLFADLALFPMDAKKPADFWGNAAGFREPGWVVD
jgi:hypothetical protein